MAKILHCIMDFKCLIDIGHIFFGKMRKEDA